MRPDIAKRRAKYSEKTMTQKIVGEQKGNFLNERPSGMDFDLYKSMRHYQGKLIHELLRGKPDEGIAAMMKPTIPSTHLQQMVFNARLKKIEAEEALLPKETPSTNLFSKVLNFFRKISGKTHEPTEVHTARTRK